MTSLLWSVTLKVSSGRQSPILACVLAPHSSSARLEAFGKLTKVVLSKAELTLIVSGMEVNIEEWEVRRAVITIAPILEPNSWTLSRTILRTVDNHYSNERLGSHAGI